MKSKQTTIRIAKTTMSAVEEKLSSVKQKSKVPLSFSSYIMILIREDLKRHGQLENLTHLGNSFSTHSARP
ncbi:MAG: hypothetical protein JWM04_555 [Verrucomicrobiales bacterium]|nr:hypothetical protein [Verrucomicrobiales bacterium]